MGCEHRAQSIKSSGWVFGLLGSLCVDFNNAVFLYSRQAMSNHQRPEYNEWGKTVGVDFMDNMDAIAKNATIAQAGNARLIKLQ